MKKRTVEKLLDKEIGTVPYLGKVPAFLGLPKVDAFIPKEVPDCFFVFHAQDELELSHGVVGAAKIAERFFQIVKSVNVTTVGASFLCRILVLRQANLVLKPAAVDGFLRGSLVVVAVAVAVVVGGSEGARERQHDDGEVELHVGPVCGVGMFPGFCVIKSSRFDIVSRLLIAKLMSCFGLQCLFL
jgi:hypothetical protein